MTAPTGAQTTLGYSAEPSTVCSVDDTSGALTLDGVGTCTITATAEASDNYNEASVTFDVTVQATGLLVLNVDDIAGDDTINIEEKASGFDISGNTGSEGGVSVTVTVGGTELTATSADADPATWTVNVPVDATYITGTSVDVTVSASKAGYTSPSDVTGTLTVDLTAPTAPGYSAPVSLKVGEAITSMSPSGGVDIDEYSAAGLPSGLGIDAGGVIGGTPDKAGASTATATVTVRDAAGNSATATIIFPAVDKGDQALTGFQYSPSSVTYGSATVPAVTAPTGVLTTLSYLATPTDVCTVDPTSGALTLLGAGDCEITATAAGSDDYNEATVGYTVTVQAAGALVLTLGVIAGDGTVNIAEKAAGFEIGGDTGTEAGVGVTVEIGGETLTTTSADDAGTATWTVSVPADAAYISGTSVAVEVNASKTGYTAPAAITRSLAVDLTAPTAPTYSAPVSLKVGEAITSMSPSGGVDIAEYGAAGLPSGLGIDTSGVISGTPEAADVATATATVTVRDAAGNTATATIIFPAVDKGDQALTGFQYSPSSVTYGSGTVPVVTAPTGARTSLSYTATPAGVCGVNPSTGALTLLGAGDCEITATAAGSDDYNEATVGYTVTVQAAGALALKLGVIATDDIINIAEKGAGFEIGGDTGTEAGVGVTVEIGGETLTTTSADDAGTATWTVSVPADAAYISGTSVAVEVNASKTGYSAPSAITRSLAVDLTAPTAPGYSAPVSLKVGEAITSMSPSGGVDIAEYGAADLPSGLGIDAGGVISGTPDKAEANTATVTITVSDAAGNTATATIIFPAVDKGDQALTGFQYSPSSVTYGSGTVPAVTAPTGVLTTLSYLATPDSMCTVDPTSGALTLLGAGDCEITATAAGSDDYNEATVGYTVTVQAAGALALTLGVIAGDGTVNIAEKAAGFEIGGDTGTEAGVGVTVEIGGETLTTTSADDAGTAIWTVSVPADAAYISGTSVAVEVNASKTGYTAPAAITRSLAVDLTAPTAPTYSAPVSLKVGEAITSMSPSGGVDIAEYGAAGLPSGLGIDTSGVISGTPEAADVATATATVTVRDAAGNTATATIIFPAVDKGDQALTGFQYSASSVSFGSTAPTVTAPTGAQTTLGYSAEPSTVCSVDDTSGALTLDGVGTCTITATAEASDNYNEASVTFDVTVQATGLLVLNVDDIAGDDTINIEEKASGFDISGNTGSEGGVSVTVTVGGTELTATSADADPATWTVNVPVDATYITGTSVDVTVSASKAGYTSPSDVTGTLTVDLTAPTAPGYSAPVSLKVGEAITSMSPSGGVDIAEYSAAGLPSGLGIDAGGVISGTPDKAEANTATVTITVSDAAGNTATATIVFPAVDKGDQALTGFQYSPSSVTYGSATVPAVTAPTGVLTTLSYLATPTDVCTVDPTSGALTLLGAGDCEITATAAGSDDYNEATVGYTVTVQAAGALALTLGVIAGDGTVNIAEKAAGFEIGGDTGTEAGVGVTVEIGGETLTTTSADDAGTAIWTVSVPADAAYISGTSVAVEVNASKTGYTAPAAITRSLAVDLTAPTAPTYSAPVSLKVGEAITSMSPSGGADIDEYSATDLPSGLGIDAGGVISGTPEAADVATATATVTVRDAAGNTATVTIIFPAVDKGDQALTGFQYSPSSVTYGSGTVPVVTAPTGARTSLSYTATPAGVCGVNPSTGALTLLGAGDCEITATAAGSDDYNEATVGYTVTVQAAGALALKLGVIATDDIINIAEKGAGFEIGGDTGTEAGVGVMVEIGGETLTTTSADDAGTATWTVSVPADAAYISGTSMDVTVSASKTGFTAPNDVARTLAVDLTAPTAPTYSAPVSLKVGEAITSMSPSGGVDIAEYGATDLPSGLGIDAGGVISGTPDKAEANTATVTITVSDAAGNTATATIIFPAVDKGDQALTGFQYSPSSVTYGSGTVPSVTAPTGVLTTLSYLATPTDVCTVDPTSGALTLLGAGDCEITATAAGSDDYNEATVGYTVTVQAAGAPGVPITVTVTSASVTSVTVTWAAPSNEGPPITDYDYRYRVKTPEGSWVEVTDTTSTAVSATIPGLAEDTEYEVQVRATNDDGTGGWSDSGSGSTTTTPGITVSKPALTVTKEDPTGDSYTVVLDTQPTAEVTVTVAGHAGTDVTPDPTTLPFTTSNWNTARTVTVTAGNDADTANDSVTLTHSAASTDTAYSGITIGGVAVTVNDNDSGNTPATGKPAISGTAQVGSTLSVETSGIEDLDGKTKAENGDAGYAYSYQWIRVDEANETDADVGKHFKVKVTFQDDRSFDESLTSKLHPARTGGICARTAQVRDGIVEVVMRADSSVTTCADVTSAHLASLGLLNLRNQSISSLKSGDFAGLTGLRQLNLSNNALSSLPANIFAGLTNLYELNLEGNALTELQAGIFDPLTALGSLRRPRGEARNNRAKIFDPLTALGSLRLDGNALTSLPSGIFDRLTALLLLDLSGNALTSLPAGIFDRLTALKTLLLADIGTLTSLPAGIFDRLTALTFLRLENNDLSSLPAGIFDRLTVLEDLNLCSTPLTELELPAGIYDRLIANGVSCLPPNVRVRRVASAATLGAPQNLSGVPGDGQVTLTWEAPSSDGGSAITGYQYEIDDSGTWLDADLDLEETVTGLTNGQPYAVAVRAVTASGPGPAAIVTATPVSTPGVPQTLRWVPGDGQVTLSWAAPSSDGGSAITRYEYEIDDSGTWLDAGLDRQVTVTGLTNDRQYTVAVRAVNAIGDGDEATATVTLGQSGPLLRAWLSRFGRTVATHVTDTVGERLRDTAAPSSYVTVGGYRLPLGTRGADPAEPRVDPRSPGKKQRPEATEAGALRLSMGMESGSAVGPKGTEPGSGDVGLDPWADRPGQDPRVGQTQALRLRDLLMGSSFRLMLGSDDARPGAMRLTAWGRVAGTQFNGRDRVVALDGDVLTGTLGVDSEWERWLAGVAVSHSRGDGSYRIAGTGGAGEVENALTSLHPYLRYAVNERLDVWGVLGYGWGDLTLKPGTDAPSETDTDFVMGAVGGRGILLSATDTGGFELATRTDAMLTRMTSDADAALDSTEAEAHRLRLVLEGTRAVTWPEGQSLTPAVEIGLRHDWGDAETGFGLELGGRVQYADPTLGLTIEAAVRGLLAHEDSNYGEWGASGSLRLAPGPDGQGLSLTLSPTWGAASSGVDGLWSRQTTAGLAPQGTRAAPTGRLNAEVSYGVPAFGAGLLSPYAGTVLTDGTARTYRLGTSWTSVSGLTLNVEGQRQEPAAAQPVNQGFHLQIGWGF